MPARAPQRSRPKTAKSKSTPRSRPADEALPAEPHPLLDQPPRFASAPSELRQDVHAAWREFFARQPHPKDGGAVEAQVNAFMEWYNNERPSGITGKTPARMQEEGIDANLDFEAERAVDQAELLIDSGKPKEAVAILRPLLKNDSYLLAAHQQLAHAHIAMEDETGARAALEAWAEVDPGCPEVYQLLSEIAVGEGDYDRALRWALTGLEVVPHDFDLNMGAAQCRRLLGIRDNRKYHDRARAVDGPRFGRFMREYWIDEEVDDGDVWIMEKRTAAAARALDGGDVRRAAELMEMVAAPVRRRPPAKGRRENAPAAR